MARNKKKIIRWTLIGLTVAIAALGMGIFLANRAVVNAAEGREFYDVQKIPHRKVGLLLGTSKYLANNRLNTFYQRRIEAAAALFKAGKIDFILISGDNSKPGYDEPTMMYKDLVELGIPENRMQRDYAGFRTLDSVVRAKEVFKTTEVTVISQKFHNDRAIYLARSRGIDAIGFVAKSPPRRYAAKTLARELLARVAAVLDVQISTEPKFLGPEIEIGGDEIEELEEIKIKNYGLKVEGTVRGSG
ncbi:MAG: YdcF family protein [Puniceicoccales bacterium]|jgi:SanA protein|nr:YdcF family protein [Puniceicoccales bacterium]